MKLRNLARSLMTAGTVTALCTLAAPVYAASAVTGTSAAISCPSGDVCLQTTSGRVVEAKGGKGSWSPPLHVDLIDNNTSVTSCVEISQISFLPVPAHETVTGNWMVSLVEPGPICPG